MINVNFPKVLFLHIRYPTLSSVPYVYFYNVMYAFFKQQCEAFKNLFNL